MCSIEGLFIYHCGRSPVLLIKNSLVLGYKYWLEIVFVEIFAEDKRRMKILSFDIVRVFQ